MSGGACLERLVVYADAEFAGYLRKFFELCDEFIDGKIGDHEVFVFEGRCFGLAAEADHCVHIAGVSEHVAHIEVDSIGIEKSECFAAPWAASFDVKDGSCGFFHAW